MTDSMATELLKKDSVKNGLRKTFHIESEKDFIEFIRKLQANEENRLKTVLTENKLDAGASEIEDISKRVIVSKRKTVIHTSFVHPKFPKYVPFGETAGLIFETTEKLLCTLPFDLGFINMLDAANIGATDKNKLIGNLMHKFRFESVEGLLETYPDPEEAQTDFKELLKFRNSKIINWYGMMKVYEDLRKYFGSHNEVIFDKACLENVKLIGLFGKDVEEALEEAKVETDLVRYPTLQDYYETQDAKEYYESCFD